MYPMGINSPRDWDSRSFIGETAISLGLAPHVIILAALNLPTSGAPTMYTKREGGDSVDSELDEQKPLEPEAPWLVRADHKCLGRNRNPCDETI